MWVQPGSLCHQSCPFFGCVFLFLYFSCCSSQLEPHDAVLSRLPYRSGASVGHCCDDGPCSTPGAAVLAGHCCCQEQFQRSIVAGEALGAFLVAVQQRRGVLGAERNQRKHHHQDQGLEGTWRPLSQRIFTGIRCSGSVHGSLLRYSRLQRGRLRRKSKIAFK